MGLLESLSSNNHQSAKPTVPSEVFASLNQKPGFDYLRAIQTDFLNQWYERRNEKDLVGVLGTGTGKTLIGLLTLQSRINDGEGPCAYLCPTKQLVDQVVQDAKNFGINVTTFSETNTGIPSNFIDSEAILVMTFDKLFNGKSVFGVNSADFVPINSLVIDDAHTMIDRAINATTLTINRKDEAYDELINLFSDDLKDQSASKLDAIINNTDSFCAMKVPYWTVYNQKDNIINILSKSYLRNRPIQYDFILESDNLLDVYVGYSEICIKPFYVPVKMVPAFSSAKHRLFLSATPSNIGDFITDLGMDTSAAKKPISIKTLSDTGQKWILATQKINPDFSDKVMRKLIVNIGEKYNVLVLVPSNRMAEEWISKGAKLYKAGNLDQLKMDLQASSSGMIAVLANKYDGIDLPEDLCHVTVIDGKPNQISLIDRANSQRIPNLTETKQPIIREIEQGMGRAVRSKSDYSLIFMLDSRLQDFVYSNASLFTEETKSQWEFFKEVSNTLKSNYPDINSSKGELLKLINGVLSQDKEWVNLYKSKVQAKYNAHISERGSNETYEKKNAELDAWNEAFDKHYVEAEKLIFRSDCVNGYDFEKLARYVYLSNKEQAFDLQKTAHEKIPYLFKSKYSSYSKKRATQNDEGTSFLSYIRANKFHDSNEVATRVKTISDNLIYANYANELEFRNSVQKLGEMMGFNSSQPEAETSFKNGSPDNLWLSNDVQILIEDKNREEQHTISRSDVEQITNSSTWFKQTYSSENFFSVLFHQSKIFNSDAHSDYDIKIVTSEKLDCLKKAICDFSMKISQHPINYWNEEKLQELFSDCRLRRKDFIDKYTVNYRNNF